MTEQDRLIDIGERLARLESVLDDVKNRLFGNGQSGELLALQARVNALEQWFWRATGAVAVVILVLHTVVPRLQAWIR